MAALLLLTIHFSPFTIHQASAALVTLAWDANAEADIAGYVLRWNGGGQYLMTNAGCSTTQTVSVARGVQYDFTVSAVDLDGVESEPSAPLTYLPPVEVVVELSLEAAADPAGPWNLVTNAPALVVTNPAGSQFFRARMNVNRSE